MVDVIDLRRVELAGRDLADGEKEKLENGPKVKLSLLDQTSPKTFQRMSRNKIKVGGSGEGT